MLVGFVEIINGGIMQQVKKLYSEKYKGRKILTISGEIEFDKDGYCLNVTDEQIAIFTKSETIQILENSEVVESDKKSINPPDKIETTTEPTLNKTTAVNLGNEVVAGKRNENNTGRK